MMKAKGHLKHLARALALFLLVSLPAFANNFRTADSVVTPNGAQIPAGVYEVTYKSHSPTATVTFKQGGRVVATLDGKWVDRDIRYDNDALVYDTNPDRTRTLIEIRFAGKKQALVLGNAR